MELRIIVALCACLVGPTALAATSTRSVASTLAGNGHNVTFDGRLFIVTRGEGWHVMVLRPERVTYDASGFPDMSADAFTPPVLIQPPTHSENALAMCETSSSDTPYRCGEDGAANAGGAYACYDLWLFDSDALSSLPELRRRRLRVVVENPATQHAQVRSFTFLTGLEGVYAGSTPLRGIEPTVTRDGKLMLWQGVPANTGAIDTLVYAYNDTPCAATGWHGPYSITHMYYDANVRGRYRLAERVLRAADGHVFADNALLRGAYPWLFPDGDAVIFTAANMPCVAAESPPGCGPRRNALSALGYPTNWFVAHIDGGVNPSTVDTVRLFFSSPGPAAFGNLPVTPGIDVWPFFGSNTANYAELVFDDGLDGGYRGVWLMNESINAAGELDRSKTPDTSGYGNTGALTAGSSFPNANSGPAGKVVELNGTTGRVVVGASSSLAPVNAMSLEVWARPSSPSDCDAADNRRVLVAKGQGVATGSYGLTALDGQALEGWVVLGSERLTVSTAAGAMPVGAFTRAALTYEASGGALRLFVNDALVQMAFGPVGATLSSDTATPLHLGGVTSAAACPSMNGSFHGALEEVRLSSVSRRPARDNDAVFVAHELPSRMYTGHASTVTVTMKNAGLATWSAGSLYRLGSQSPQDNAVWGTNRVVLPADVDPGEEVVFVVEVTPPATLGDYPMQWRMVQEGIEWFGDFTRPQVLPVLVRVNDAQYVAQNVPTALRAGQGFTASVTLRNTGTTAWPAQGDYVLASLDASDAALIVDGAFTPGVAVEPESEVTFDIHGTAPSAAGAYSISLRMREAGQWFGAATPSLQVTVSVVNPDSGCGDACTEEEEPAAPSSSGCSSTSATPNLLLLSLAVGALALRARRRA